MSKLAELLKDAGPPISRVNQRLRDTPVTLSRNLLLELEAVLHLRNGFTAADGVIIVRPSVTVGRARSVDDWNQLTLWRTPYRAASEVLFFAETVFGAQFGLYRDEVVLFDPETGERQTYVFSLERWADKVLGELDLLGRTGLRMWELEHKPLEITERLQRRRPKRFGGDDTDVTVVSDIELMKRCGVMYKANLETMSTDIPKLDNWWAGPDEVEPAPAPSPEPAANEPMTVSAGPSDAEAAATDDDEQAAILAEIARELAKDDPEHEAAKAAAAAPPPKLDEDLPPPAESVSGDDESPPAS